MEKIEKDDIFNAKFGISLEESASSLTKGRQYLFAEGADGYRYGSM